MKSKVLWWAVLVIGVALIVAPLAMGLPGKAAAGERMLSDFHPLMQPAAVQKTADYYNDVFTPLGQMTPMFTVANADKLSGYMDGMQKAGIQIPAQAASDFSALIAMMRQGAPVAAQVPAGLEWYKPLVTTMQGNVSDYASVDSLPNFNLFTWFFIVPGVLLVLLGGAGLWTGGALHVHIGRPHPAA
jgi:hypothetical protein